MIDVAQAQLNVANSLLQKGLYQKAATEFENIIKNNYISVDIINNLAACYLFIGDYLKVEKLLIEKLENKDWNIDLLNKLAVVYNRTNRTDQAIVLLEEYIIKFPKHIDTHHNLIEAYVFKKEFNKALKISLNAINLNPTNSNIYVNIGCCFKSLAKFDEAKIAFLTALDLDKNNIEASINLGTFYYDQGDNDNALATYKNALKKAEKFKPNLIGPIKFLMSFALLRLGDLKNSWIYYESGFDKGIPNTNSRSPKRTFLKPAWNRYVKQKKVLLWREQGIGDEFLFLSCLNDFKDKFKNDYIYETDERLVTLLQRSFPDIMVRTQDFGNPPDFLATNHDYDYHLPIGSLMLYTRQNLSDFNNSKPYISVDPVLKNKFCDRLKELNNKKIGISWRGGVIDSLRALNYNNILNWTEIFKLENTSFINLQYGECESECFAAEEKFGIKIIRWNDLNLKDDLDHVAALISNLDYVVTVATAVQHLSAAVGAKTLLLSDQGTWVRFGQNYDPWFKNLIPFYNSNDENLNNIARYIKNGL
jgi:Flp pilus assembly protein TadD